MMNAEHSPEEKTLIEAAYLTVCDYTTRCSVRLVAYLDNACARVAAKCGNDTTAKALVLDELYNGVTNSRELRIGDNLLVVSSIRTTDGLDTAYWVGFILSSIGDGRIDPEVNAACEESWLAHSGFVSRIGQDELFGSAAACPPPNSIAAKRKRSDVVIFRVRLRNETVCVTGYLHDTPDGKTWCSIRGGAPKSLPRLEGRFQIDRSRIHEQPGNGGQRMYAIWGDISPDQIGGGALSPITDCSA